MKRELVRYTITIAIVLVLCVVMANSHGPIRDILGIAAVILVTIATIRANKTNTWE